MKKILNKKIRKKNLNKNLYNFYIIIHFIPII